ncbi:MAG: hypothetical protein ACI4K6_02725 [Candidatus Fimenecus sp.]
MANYRGVKFYSKNDLSSGVNLKKAEPIIENFSKGKEYFDVNEVIELYNIKQFFDNGIKLLEWTPQKYQTLQSTVQSFMASIGKFFSKLNADNFEKIISEVDFLYRSDFFSLLDLFKVQERIPSPLIKELLEHEKIRLHNILLCKNITYHFQDVIREYMLEDAETAEILLSNYLEKESEKYYIPKCLSAKDKEKILNNYIGSPKANPNYLHLIFVSNPSQLLPFSDKTKLKARKAYEQSVEEMFKDSPGYCYGVSVTFSGSQSKEIVENYHNHILEFSYGTSWIRDNLDFPTLLNNFIFLFNFTDLYFRSQWYHRESQRGTLEALAGIQGKSEYFTGVYFDLMSMLSLSQITGYASELQKNHIELETMIEWFFKEYLKEEFGVENYLFSAPSSQASYVEKCKLLAIEFERILKQFTLYVEDAVIDQELLEISSTPVKFEDIPSMIPNKYLYPVEKECRYLMHLLFSDQSIIHFTEKFQSKYHSFYELIKNESIFKSDFFKYQIPEIHYLIERKILSCDNHNQLFLNSKKAWLLKDLYDNGVSRTDYVSNFLSAFDEQEQKAMFTFGSTLFSAPEQSYLNYMLNNSEFSNALALRNSYLHGTNPTDEKANRQDYYQILKLLVLAVIKINEEFCFADEHLKEMSK